MKKKHKFTITTIIFICLFLFLFYIFIKLEKPKAIQPISYLSFNDLTTLCKQSYPGKELSLKLNKQLTNPYIINKTKKVINSIFTAYSMEPRLNKLRIAHWNIQRGLNLNPIKTIFLGNSKYFYSYKNNLSERKHPAFNKETQNLASCEILCLNEADIGVPRTKYQNIVSEIANTLNYNYAFATEFIELSPLIYKHSLDQEKYTGLHGNAIISKHPILSAKIIRLPKCYDWFNSELKRKSPLESARRYGAKVIFNENITSEIRLGSRCALVADIELPNKEIITVVSVHLEDRCFPDCRFKQMDYLLNKLKYTKTPLVLAGDLNTTGTDSAPTSITKEIVKRLRDRDFIARQFALAALPGIPVINNIASVVFSKAFQYKDPASPNIPVVFPNQERKLFKLIKSFQFIDGEGFDLSGEARKSSNKKRGFLANSNERQLKGFESTFKFEEPRIIAYYKLDWFFVKPKASRFKPFNGQTLQLVNEAFPGKISDHDPITVDLSL